MTEEYHAERQNIEKNADEWFSFGNMGDDEKGQKKTLNLKRESATKPLL